MPTQLPTLERDLEAFFYARVRSAGGIVLKLAPTIAGMPDRLVLFPPGRLYLAELKTERGPVSPKQRYFHERCAEIGVKVHVLRGRGEILKWIREHCESFDA